MNESTLLARFSIAGPARPGNPKSSADRSRWDYRRRIEQAARGTCWRRRIPDRGDLGLRIRVHRRSGTVMDADNVAKPILDALGPWVGRVNGRVADERIARLEVVLDSTSPQAIQVELHALGE